MFNVNQVYVRRDLHDRYGGQRQGGISTPALHPLVFLFTGESGEMYGYDDGWNEDGTFRYSGEGQIGDMKFVRGNLAIRDHAINGKDLHLFQKKGNGKITYIGNMSYIGHCYIDGALDRIGKPRRAIVFRLRRNP